MAVVDDDFVKGDIFGFFNSGLEALEAMGRSSLGLRTLGGATSDPES